jgi:excisionase family DNA binding protein
MRKRSLHTTNPDSAVALPIPFDPASATGRAARGPARPPSSNSLEPLAVTVRQACEASNLGPTTIWKLIGTGALATVRIGRRRLVLYASLKALLGA